MEEKDMMESDLKEIPEGSRLEKYIEELPEILKNNEKTFSFLVRVFGECMDFIWENVQIAYPPRITLKFVPSHEEFKIEEDREAEEGTRTLEMKKSFVAGDKLSKRIYVDLQAHTNLLKYNILSFIITLVDTYIHEIVQIGFGTNDKETYNRQRSFVKDFLVMKLHDKKRNINASK